MADFGGAVGALACPYPSAPGPRCRLRSPGHVPKQAARCSPVPAPVTKTPTDSRRHASKWNKARTASEGHRQATRRTTERLQCGFSHSFDPLVHRTLTRFCAPMRRAEARALEYGQVKRRRKWGARQQGNQQPCEFAPNFGRELWLDAPLLRAAGNVWLWSTVAGRTVDQSCPSLCLPTYSAGVDRLLLSWEISLTVPTPPAGSVSGMQTP